MDNSKSNKGKIAENKRKYWKRKTKVEESTIKMKGDDK